MEIDLEGYSKLASYSGTGTGIGHYIDVYHTTFGSVSEINGIAICNSSSSKLTFKLWQVSNNIWLNTGDWNSGLSVEPPTAIKDRIFYNTEIPANMTIFLPISIIMQENQYLIFKSSTDVNISIWGKEDPYVPPTTSVIDEFVDLNDTPLNYTGKQEYLLQVNNGETAIEFTDTPTIPNFNNALHDHSNNTNGGKIASSNVTVVSSGFSKNLNGTDVDVQTALNTIDALVTGGPGSDTTAIHNNETSEISAITEKTIPIVSDYLIIEDSADSNNKKMVKIGNLPGGDINDALKERFLL